MIVRKPFSVKHLIITFCLLLAALGCGDSISLHWSEFIPANTSYMIIPEQETSVNNMLSEPYMPLFDDISPSAIQLVTTLENDAPEGVNVEAMLIFADTSNDWQPVWITRAPSGFMSEVTRRYRKPFEQNQYRFRNHTIQKLFVSDRVFFAVEVGDWLLISESSLGIENILRTATGLDAAMEFSNNQVQPGRFVINTKGFERIIHQIAQIAYRPDLLGIFEGAEPISFEFQENPEQDWQWQLTGNTLLGEDRSTLIRTISAEPREFTLDRYIPLNTAAFAILQDQPRAVPRDNAVPEGNTDQYIEENLSVWRNISSNLQPEVAYAAFAESGASSTSEFLYLRRINNASEIRNSLNELVQEGLATRDGNTFSIQSKWLGTLFGSELNPMSDFYITVYNEVAALTRRKGLAESIGSESSRRRVMYYEDDYMNIRSDLPDPLSSIIYVSTSEFSRFIEPWLNPQNYLNDILSNLDHLVITTQLQPDESSLIVQATSYQLEDDDLPFEEQWVFPLGGSRLTGSPILVDIGGSSRDEVIFSTENGSVYALATDGTVMLEVSTGNDEPIGPPVVYDWYGNNQQIIMQAAGNKIYAWNDSGDELPNFPAQLNETITTPLTVMDVTRNGVAEMIVATANRQLHILDSRGNAINGWPQSTNSVIRNAPLITEVNSQRSVFAFAENTLHGWDISGNRRNGFPVFLNSQINGEPVKFNNHLLGAGSDGNLYAVGMESLFADTLSTTHSSDSLEVQSLSVSNNGLNATPSIHNLLMQDNDDEFIRENLILLQADDGAIFLYNSAGELRFTRTLGQPASGSFSPIVIDLDNNQRVDIVALADFGRLYAWDVLNRERLYDLPTTGMSYPVIADLLGNGYKEIIAETRNGLRSWTIYRTRRSGD